MDAKTFLLQNIVQTLGKTQVEFKCGDCAGPFKLTNEGGCVRITLSNFTGESMNLSIEATTVTKRIQFCASPLLANCVILQTGTMVQIFFTKDILESEALRAILVADMNFRAEQEKAEKAKIPEYECTRCRVAKFNSLQNLRVHEQLYCRDQKETEVAANDEKATAEPQNLILLPLAFHDMPQQNAIQVMGPIHSVVPVAIGRKSTTTQLSTSPMFVTNKSRLEMPRHLSILNQKLSISIPVIDLDEKPSTFSPLDLSSGSRAASVPSVSACSSPTSKSSASSEPTASEKPFSCSCGVSFSSQKTFDAHKQFYCKHSETSSCSGAIRNEASRKVPEKCPQCEFVPLSSSQLAMHIRTAHQTAKTFTCLVCGYRAFSMRGVRTHMRSHPTEEALKFKVNEPT